MLKEATLVLQRLRGAASALEREFNPYDYRWVIPDDCSSPFSFSNACQLPNVAPEPVREYRRQMQAPNGKLC